MLGNDRIQRGGAGDQPIRLHHDTAEGPTKADDNAWQTAIAHDQV